MSILIFLIVSYLLLSISLYFLFPKAGVEAKKGLIPGVNFAEWCKLIGRKPSYAWRLLIPIVNIFVFAGMAVDLVRSFDKLGFLDSAAAVIYAPAKFAFMANDNNTKYVGPILQREQAYMDEIKAARDANDTYKIKNLEANNPYKKTPAREWTESIVFAVFAASFIRMFLIEAFVIPTPSMEGSLNVGDFLFVSKANYGIRTPQTIAMLPLLHNRIPGINKESYFAKPSLPYFRFPALEKIESGKPIVFNWPAGDSVYITSSRSYFAEQIKQNPEYVQYDKELAKAVKNKEIVVRPVDKRDHYIKRCIAVAGDSLQIIDKQVYLNGKPMKNPEHMQFLYTVQIPPNVNLNKKKLDEWGIDEGDAAGRNGLFLDQKQVDQLKSLDPEVKIELYKNEIEPMKLFPHDPVHFNTWSVDNFGPIWIPKKGVTIQLTPENIALYRRVIGVYEGNTYKEEGGKYIINGQAATSYTFKMDYYWAMGDNRHNSEDSRMWGFVPEDHIVGKPLFIWFSTREGNIKDGINWDRIFTSANKQ